jgi:hypothetical protein
VRERLDLAGVDLPVARSCASANVAASSGKVAIARRLRQETVMSLKWLAQRLETGTWTYASNLLNTKVAASPGQEMLPLFQ